MNLPENLRDNYVLLASLILLLIITILAPYLVPQYPYFINWNTILTLAALFLITTAMRDSQYLDITASKAIKRIRKERNLAIMLIFLAFFLSMVITNDVALLILVPLTLSLQKYIAKDIKMMIIFEVLAVNAGSALTPIGNPQNLYLWQIWGIGFYQFMYILFPLTIGMLLILLLFAMFAFPSKCMEKIEIENPKNGNKNLALLSIALLVILIIFMDLRIELYIIPVIFIVYALYGRKTYLHVDWLLLLTFVLFFIDFNALGNLPLITDFLSYQNINGSTAFAYGAIFSQFISNVPAAILLGNFTQDMKMLVYGVSVGGNGTIIASLANLIALRFVRDKKWTWEFHKYSLAYFAVTFLLVLIIIHFL